MPTGLRAGLPPHPVVPSSADRTPSGAWRLEAARVSGRQLQTHILVGLPKNYKLDARPVPRYSLPYCQAHTLRSASHPHAYAWLASSVLAHSGCARVGEGIAAQQIPVSSPMTTFGARPVACIQIVPAGRRPRSLGWHRVGHHALFTLVYHAPIMEKAL